MGVTVRQATPADEADVEAFTRDTWSDRGGDYLPRVFADWVASDDEHRRTFVATTGDEAVAVLRCVMVSRREAWMQGMRVAPVARGQGLSVRLHDAAAAWAHDRGGTVGRCMVFSWNVAGLAAARAVGFAPATAFRWAHPAPDPAAAPALDVVADPAAGWRYWRRSPAREHLHGLALSMDEPWAHQELLPMTLDRAAAETAVLVVRDDGPRGLALRVRDEHRTAEDGDPEHWAVYGVAAWADEAACAALVAAIAGDAASVGADRTRVLIPETVAAVSDVALAGADLADGPDFVLEADLADRR